MQTCRRVLVHFEDLGAWWPMLDTIWDLTSGSWPQTREGSTWPPFGGTTGRHAALSLLAGEGIVDGHVRRRLPIHELGDGLGRAADLLRSPRPAHDDAPVGREVRG